MKLYLRDSARAAAAFGETKGAWKGTITDSMCVNDHA